MTRSAPRPDHQSPPRPAHNPSSDQLLSQVMHDWGGKGDLWVFGYASLIWRPEFDFAEQRFAVARGWHRALKMWSIYNRGSPQVPGLVFALLPGGSCKGMVYRIAQAEVARALPPLWEREMPGASYQPRWLRCTTDAGAVTALAFTLPKSSAEHTGVLLDTRYADIFATASGRYGTTLDYAQRTFEQLSAIGIHDRALERLLKLAAPN